MSSKYSDERLEEILSEFKDISAAENIENTESAPEQPGEAIEDIYSDGEVPEEAAPEKEAEPHKKRASVNADKLLKFIGESGFSVKSCTMAALSLVLFITAWALPTEGLLRLFSFIITYLIAGYNVIFAAVQAVRSGKWYDDNLIVSVATIAAFCVGLARDAAAVMTFFTTVRLLTYYAENRAGIALEALKSVRPESARVERNGNMETVPAQEISVGEQLIVAPGESIALDGVVTDGMSDVDITAIAGHSSPETVTAGDLVFAGSINISSQLKIRVAAAYPDTAASHVVDYVHKAADRKSGLENMIDRVSKIFMPAILCLSLLTAILPSAISGDWLTWLRRAIIIISLSSPCTLAAFTTFAYYGGIITAARSGIVIKGHNVLEALAHLDTVVFDKTGTITEGRFDVTGIFPQNMSESELLDLAATAESCSEHPIARSLREIGHIIVPEGEKVLSIEEIPGRGVSAFIGGKQVYVGNAALLEEHGISFTVPSRPGAAIHVAADGIYAGHIMISDRIRNGAFDALEELRAAGAKTLVMLTGDVRSAAKSVAVSLNFDMVKSELTLAGKTTAVEYMLSKKTPGTYIAFVGDGVSDKEVLARADVGIAMAALGSDEAIDSADVVLLGSDIRSLPLAARMCRHVSDIVRQNIILAIAAKLFALLLGVLGVIPLWIATLADSGASAAIIINSLRTLKKE